MSYKKRVYEICVESRVLPTFRVLRIASSGMLRLVALVRTDLSEELSASTIRVTRICELGTSLALTSHRRTLRRNIAACVGC
jgi:hypothetical protein